MIHLQFFKKGKITKDTMIEIAKEIDKKVARYGWCFIGSKKKDVSIVQAFQLEDKNESSGEKWREADLMYLSGKEMYRVMFHLEKELMVMTVSSGGDGGALSEISKKIYGIVKPVFMITDDEHVGSHTKHIVKHINAMDGESLICFDLFGGDRDYLSKYYILSPEYVKKIGKNKILGTKPYKIEELKDGALYIETSQDDEELLKLFKSLK